MDPVSAFALAGTVLQVLDLSKQYLTLVWEVYKSSAPGADGEESSLAQTRNALLAVTESLQGSLSSSESGAVGLDSTAELARNESLERLAKDCNVVAQRLLVILQKTVPKGQPRRRDAFKTAFRLISSEDEMKRLDSLIAKYRDQFSFLLLTSIREYVRKSATQQQEILDKLGFIHDQAVEAKGSSSAVIEYLAQKAAEAQAGAVSSAAPQVQERAAEIESGLARALRSDFARATDSRNRSQTSDGEIQVVQDAILSHLHFKEEGNRQYRIARAHKATFGWVFKQADAGRPGSSSGFKEWLTSDKQLFWITGKPGAGKSTLMKYLAGPDDGEADESEDDNGSDEDDASDLESAADEESANGDVADEAAIGINPGDIRGPSTDDRSAAATVQEQTQRSHDGTVAVRLNADTETGTCLDRPDSALRTSSERRLGKANSPGHETRCHPYLKAWAGRLSLVTAGFYFWNSGTALQFNQSGLFRSLLHQLLDQRREYIPLLFPEEWETASLFGIQILGHEDDDSPILQYDLRKLLLRLVRLLSKNSKVCLFIDGLDEFQGEPGDLILLVKRLAHAGGPHIKLCVASRPWSAFQDAYGSEANLRLEDLTYNDIKAYVTAEMETGDEFVSIGDRYPGFAATLIENIVTKASGVFLWVSLVVRSLLEGLSNGDRKEDLQKRLDELPPDLESLYDKILRGLDPTYREHASQYFKLMEQTRKTHPWCPFTLLLFMLADEETPKSAIAHERVEIERNVFSPTMKARLRAMERRLNSCSKGLLEVQSRPGFWDGWPDVLGRSGGCAQIPEVQYLHRSVQDFMQSPEARKTLQLDQESSFDPALQLLAAYVIETKMSAWIRRQCRLFCGPRSFPGYIGRSVDQAVLLRKDNQSQSSSLLNALATAFDLPETDPNLRDGHIVRLDDSTQWTGTRWPSSISDYLMVAACIRGLITYVQDQAPPACLVNYRRIDSEPTDADAFLKGDPRRLGTPFQYSLLFALIKSQDAKPDMVACLLELGADPNYQHSDPQMQTPWISALTMVDSLERGSLETEDHLLEQRERWRKCLMLLLAHGAKTTPSQRQQLTPASQALLMDLERECKKKRPSSAGWSSWLPWLSPKT